MAMGTRTTASTHTDSQNSRSIRACLRLDRAMRADQMFTWIFKTHFICRSIRLEWCCPKLYFSLNTLFVVFCPLYRASFHSEWRKESSSHCNLQPYRRIIAIILNVHKKLGTNSRLDNWIRSHRMRIASFDNAEWSKRVRENTERGREAMTSR